MTLKKSKKKKSKTALVDTFISVINEGRGLPASTTDLDSLHTMRAWLSAMVCIVSIVEV